MQKNNFNLPNSRWESLGDQGQERFNEVYPEIQKQQKQFIGELPTELRGRLDEKTIEPYTKVVVAETVRANQLHESN